ncbi:MAG TPA: DUF4292 domain-containing protein [Myxococcaceae bacterium]|nr:DUF4292 domain-containing protein [Myxococcaceae bacterium]
MNRLRIAMFLALTCLGCTKRIAAIPVEGRLTDPEELLARVDAAEAKAIAVRGDARLHVDSRDARGSAGLFVSVAHPAFIHLEPLDFFNRPQGVLVSDGRNFTLYSVPENQVLVGPASPPNVSRLLPILIPAEELVAVMLGRAPRLPEAERTLTYDEQARTYRLELRKDDVVQTLWVHPEHFRVMRSEIRGAPAYDLQFADFMERAEVALPRHIILASQAGEARLELRYRDVVVNGPLDLTDFEFEPPPGVPVTEVDARGVAIDPSKRGGASPGGSLLPLEPDADGAPAGDAPRS